MGREDITLDDLSQAIEDTSFRLRFAPALERAFETDTSDARCRRLIRNNIVGIATYNAFLVGDYFLVGDIFAASLILHLLVMTPIMGLVIAALAARPVAWARESMLAGGIILGTAAILGLMLYSRSPLRSSEHFSVVLVILFATMVQRIRFPYVVVACLVSLGLYIAALTDLAAYEPARAAVAAAVLAGAVLFSLIGCYNLEAEQRMSYLLGLRDKLRNAELEALSRYDALTGIGNRRALDLALARGEPGRSTAVLLCDIDHFKAYNDANGHIAGDLALRRVAASIAGSLREGLDDVFRFGGEEFLVLLDVGDLAEALAFGERIRSAVEADGVVSISIGAAAGPCYAMATIIASADSALYEAKSRGRNRVCASPQDRPERLVAA